MTISDVLVQPPQKRKNHYLSQITDAKGKKIRIKISGASWIHLHPVEGDGHVLRLYLPEDVDQLNEIDDIVLQSTIEHNHSWFPNAMSEDTVRSLFRPSLHKKPLPTLGLYVSVWKDPIVMLDGKQMDSIHQLPNIPKQAKVTVDMEAIGVCFFRQKFGVRWLVRKLWISTSQNQEDDLMHEDVIERDDVEASWEQELEDIKQVIEKEKLAFQSKINNLNSFYQSVHGILNDAKSEVDTTIWNEKLENLSKHLAKYRSGALTTPL